MLKRFLILFLIFLQTLVFAQVPHPDVSQDSTIVRKKFKIFNPKQLIFLPRAVLELWAPRFYPSQKTLTQWRGGTVAKQIDLTLGDEPIRGQTFEADQARFQNPHGDFTMFGGGIRVKENLALIFKEGECNLYGTQLEGLGEESKVLLYGGKQLTFEAETLDGHSSLGRTRHLGTSPTLKFQEALVYGGPGGLFIQSAILQVPKQLTLLSEGEIGVGALASELRSYQGGGDNWRKDVRITHRLTQAEVGNLLIATPDNLKLTGVEVTGTSAKIQLGGGYLADSPQDVYHHSHHTESDGWFSSSSEDVSYTVQTTRRNVLNVEATTLSAGLFLDRGGDYRGHTHVTSPKAQLEAVLDKLERMESSTDSNLFFKSGSNSGEIRHTPVFTTSDKLTLSTAHAHLDTLPGQLQPGWLKLEPFDPATLQPPHVGALLQDVWEESQTPRIQEALQPVDSTMGREADGPLLNPDSLDPELTLHPVQGAYEHWDQSYFGLTPGFAAVVALAVTIATGGTGGPAAQAATAMGFGAEGAVFLAAKAGIQAVAASTVVGTLNHQGNVFKAVEDMAKPDSLRAIAASIVTAGLVEDISHTLKLPDVPKTFGEHFQHAAIKGAVSLPVNATLGGVDPDKALGAAALGVVANTMGGFAATEIGKAYGAESLSYAEHKALHAGLGAITGAIIDPKNPGKGALSGALGAVVGETVAEALPTSINSETRGDLGKFAGPLAAFLAGQDVAPAIHTAENAIENNFLPHAMVGGGLAVAANTEEGKKVLAEIEAQTQAALEKERAIGYDNLREDEQFLVSAYHTGVLKDLIYEKLDALAGGNLSLAHDWVSKGLQWTGEVASDALKSLNASETMASHGAAFTMGAVGSLVPSKTQALATIGKTGKKLTGPIKISRVEKEVQFSESGRIYGTHKELKNSKAIDSHHIIQDKAVQDIPGYNRNEAPTVQLKGPPEKIGTEHHLATKEQRRAGGGTYGSERIKAYRALRKAGVDKGEAKFHIQRADDYFSQLGVTKETPTNIPKNRKGIHNAQQ